MFKLSGKIIFMIPIRYTCAYTKPRSALVCGKWVCQCYGRTCCYISTGIVNHSHHPHLMLIVSPMYTGSRKRKMRLPALLLEPALLCCKICQTYCELTWASIIDLEMLVSNQVTNQVTGTCDRNHWTTLLQSANLTASNFSCTGHSVHSETSPSLGQGHKFIVATVSSAR